ncbi:MAG: Membrane protein insertase YidC 2 [candidate division WS2 bacterium]|nr:Membrane protein insertase YidC 2 [Candidatus Psychracetigena formicireducens]
MIEVIANFLISMLQFFYGLVKNYGLSIILLTTVIKLALTPSAISQFKQQRAMEKIKPLEAEIRKKFKDKPEKLNQEIMKLYKEQGFKPFGSCLMLLIQFPIWFGLFRALSTYEAFSGATFLWIKNLSLPDPYILPILVGVTTYFQFKLTTGRTPSNPDNPMSSSMAIMNYIFPFLLAYMTTQFPAGLGIYWVWFGLLTAVEQVVLRWRMKN